MINCLATCSPDLSYFTGHIKDFVDATKLYFMMEFKAVSLQGTERVNWVFQSHVMMDGGYAKIPSSCFK